jgi:hypothetical protein
MRTRQIFGASPTGVAAVPGDPATLRAIGDLMAGILSQRRSRAVAHWTENELKEVDHLLAIHVLGYEFNERERPDEDGDRWTWRIPGLSSDSTSPVRPWTRDMAEAAHMARRFCPGLRMDVRVGGRKHGQVRSARFARSAPFGLAGAAVPLPENWPAAVRDYPTATLVFAFLEAVCQEKEAAQRLSAA